MTKNLTKVPNKLKNIVAQPGIILKTGMTHREGFLRCFTVFLAYLLVCVQADVISYAKAISHCSYTVGQDCRQDKDNFSFTSYRVTDESYFLDDFTEMKSDIVVIFSSSKKEILESAKDWDLRYKYYFFGEDVIIMSKIDHASTKGVHFDGVGTVELFNISGHKVAVLGAIITEGDKKMINQQKRKISKALRHLEGSGYQCILALDITNYNANMEKVIKVGKTSHYKVGIPRAENRNIFTYFHEGFLTRSLPQPHKAVDNDDDDDELSTVKFSMLCAVGKKFDCRGDKEILKVVSFNAQLLFSDLSKIDETTTFRLPLPENIVPHMKDVASLLEATDADVILLQEVQDWETLAIVASMMTTQKGLYKPYVMQGDIINVGMLTKISPETGPVPFLRIKGRSMVTKFKVGEKNIAIANVHFISPERDLNGMKREKSIQELLNMVNVVRNEEYEILVVGDFNATNEEADLEGLFYENELFDPSILYYSPGKAYTHMKAIVGQQLDLDHFYVTPSLLEKVSDFVIDNGERRIDDYNIVGDLIQGNAKISDHFPMMATFQLGNNLTNGGQLQNWISNRELNRVTKRASSNSDATSFIWSLYNFEKDPSDDLKSDIVYSEFIKMFVSDKFGTKIVHDEFMTDFIAFVKKKNYGTDQDFNEYFEEMCLSSFSVLLNDIDDRKRLALLESCKASINGKVIKIRPAEPIILEPEQAIVHLANELIDVQIPDPIQESIVKKSGRNTRKKTKNVAQQKSKRNPLKDVPIDYLSLDFTQLKEFIQVNLIKLINALPVKKGKSKIKISKIDTKNIPSLAENVLDPMMKRLFSLIILTEDAEKLKESWSNNFMLKINELKSTSIKILNQKNVIVTELSKLLSKINRLLSGSNIILLVDEIISASKTGVTKHEKEIGLKMFGASRLVSKKYRFLDLVIMLVKAIIRNQQSYIKKVSPLCKTCYQEKESYLIGNSFLLSSNLMDISERVLKLNLSEREKLLSTDQVLQISLLLNWIEALRLEVEMFCENSALTHRKKAELIVEFEKVYTLLKSAREAYGLDLEDDILVYVNEAIYNADIFLQSHNVKFYSDFLILSQNNDQFFIGNQNEPIVSKIFKNSFAIFIYANRFHMDSGVEEIDNDVKQLRAYVNNYRHLFNTDIESKILLDMATILDNYDNYKVLSEEKFEEHRLEILRVGLRLNLISLRYSDNFETSIKKVDILRMSMFLFNSKMAHIRRTEDFSTLIGECKVALKQYENVIKEYIKLIPSEAMLADKLFLKSRSLALKFVEVL